MQTQLKLSNLEVRQAIKHYVDTFLYSEVKLYKLFDVSDVHLYLSGDVCLAFIEVEKIQKK